MTERKKPPPPEGFSAFKKFAERIVKVPKREIDEKETDYQRERAKIKKRVS